jgi:hypothetical protein
VVVAALAALGYFTKPTSPPPTPSPTTQSVNLINTRSQVFGPGTDSAAVLPFTIPSDALDAWVNGTFSVTVCTTIGDYCLANAAIFTPSSWMNFLAGGKVTVVWCYSISGSCLSEQNVAVASGDLGAYAGQTLDLCLYSNATTESQTFSANINFIDVITG